MAQTFPPWMMEIMQVYMPFCGLKDITQWPDSCNVNLYEDGDHSVGWHADDEVLFQGKDNDIRILSLSLGAVRRFDLIKNWAQEGEQPGVEVTLYPGSLCTMEGMVQKHYRHRICRSPAVQEPRINLTWRWIRRHSTSCPKRHWS
jgi:alkylated DNA repair dioxygenase AlkB